MHEQVSIYGPNSNLHLQVLDVGGSERERDRERDEGEGWGWAGLAGLGWQACWDGIIIWKGGPFYGPCLLPPPSASSRLPPLAPVVCVVVVCAGSITCLPSLAHTPNLANGAIVVLYLHTLY